MSRRVDIATAATVLGLSQAAVKKRLQRGSIAGGKDDTGRWYADLDDAPGFEQFESFAAFETPRRRGVLSFSHHEAVAGLANEFKPFEPNGHATGQDDTRDTTWDDAPLIVVALRETIAILRDELAGKNEQLRQANVIIAQLTSRPLELAPLATTVQASPATSEPEADVIDDLGTNVPILPADDVPPRRRWWRFWW